MDDFDHGIPDNPYNKHAWIFGEPEIGERVWIGAFCLIDGRYAALKIGRGTDISSGAQIVTHSTVRRCISERRYSEIDAAPTEVGEFCFIGTNAVILKGCKIGHHSVIGAGAVVPENTTIPPYSLVLGVPAKVVGSSRRFLKGIDKESLSVVIPAYNEKKTIENVVNEATKVLSKLKIDYEIVLVDDGSTDGTSKIIDSLARRKKIRAVHHKQNKGFTGAMKTAFASAKKNLVFLAPADGQFDFNQLPDFLDAVRGYDAALGYRIKSEETIVRKVESKMFHFASRILFGINFREITSVSLWRKRIFQSIEIKSDDRSAMMLPELVYKAIVNKNKFTEVPIIWRKRRGGISKGVHLHPMALLKTFSEMVKLWIRIKING